MLYHSFQTRTHWCTTRLPAHGLQGRSSACWGDGRDHAADLVRDAAVLPAACTRDRQDHISCSCQEAPGLSVEVLEQSALVWLVQKAEQGLTAQAAAATHSVSCRSAGLHPPDRDQPRGHCSLVQCHCYKLSAACSHGSVQHSSSRQILQLFPFCIRPK